MKYPKWFPYPSAWLNAILLGLLTGLAGYVMRVFFWAGIGAMAMTEDPEPVVLLSALALLSPIVVIAIVHHCIHLLLSRLAPKIQAPEIGKITGLFPGLFSWWEGLWSWTVMMTGILVTFIIALLTYEHFDIVLDSYTTKSDEERFISFLSFVFLVFAAYLYQFAYLIEQRLRKASDSIR